MGIPVVATKSGLSFTSVAFLGLGIVGRPPNRTQTAKNKMDK